MRAQFVLSEMWIGLRRNFTMTVAVVITAAIALTLFGLGLMVRNQVNLMKGYWYGKVEVSIFLKSDVTQAQKDQLQADLAAMPEVEETFYESKQDAYERFKVQFKDSPELLRDASPEVLPESFRVKLKDPKKFSVVSSAFADRPGVFEVANQKEVLDRLFDVLNGIRTAMLWFAFLSLVAATILIGNTVRVAAFSRRRETGIMRLVGASNLYIQLPFLLEGVVAGVVGALAASALCAGAQAFLINKTLRPNIKITAFVGWDQFQTIVPVLVVTGVVVAGTSSFLTLRRYLRV